MWAQLIQAFSSLIFFILHVGGSGSFPKALSSSDEKKYLNLMKNGDITARNTLIEHNLRLVAHVLKKYYTLADQEDLISIGTIGLIKGIDTFNPDKGSKLSSYASKCVENEVLMYFRSSKKTNLEVSLNEPIDTDKDGNSLTIMDTMSLDDDVIDFVDKRIKCKKIYENLEKCLDKRELKIIILRYGLNGKKALTQREVSKKLNLSRSYISRIEKKALLKLRSSIEG